MIEKVRARFSRGELERRASEVRIPDATTHDPPEDASPPPMGTYKIVLAGSRAVRLQVRRVPGTPRSVLLLEIVDSHDRTAFAKLQLNAGGFALLVEHLQALKALMRDDHSATPTNEERRTTDDDESDQTTNADRSALGSDRPPRPTDAEG